MSASINDVQHLKFFRPYQLIPYIKIMSFVIDIKSYKFLIDQQYILIVTILVDLMLKKACP